MLNKVIMLTIIVDFKERKNTQLKLKIKPEMKHLHQKAFTKNTFQFLPFPFPYMLRMTPLNFFFFFLREIK